MSELTIQESIQDTIQALSAFADDDVSINDWDFLDLSQVDKSRVIIGTADDFNSRQDTVTPDTTWQIPVMLFVEFTDWKTSLDQFQVRRQQIIDEFNSTAGNRNPGTGAVTADVIRNEGGIEPFYYAYTREEDRTETLPIMIFQTLIFEVREF